MKSAKFADQSKTCSVKIGKGKLTDYIVKIRKGEEVTYTVKIVGMKLLLCM
jgi:hypothetical protein